ncbi:DUF1109 domain-containing protein [Erwinia sp.]|uniref:DUF1109 domain-containing protein n=1 Tax=Erwinia citreus TaxID=558 RepID=UPI0028A0D35C|nr:DUF1109 domain-containing protein [Erwinia sp.]
MRNHDRFIDQLSDSARPVKRLWPTGWRVAAWVALALPCGMLSSWALHGRFTDWSRPDALPALAGLLLAFVLGTGAMAGAFTLSLAGRRPVRLKWLGILALIWLALNLGNMSSTAPPAGAGQFGEGVHCYLFMLSASLPMTVIAVAALYRSRSLYPGKSLALAGGGIAFMSSMLLSLCHQTHLHMLDFIMHLAAGLTITAVTVLAGRRWVRLDPSAG